MPKPAWPHPSEMKGELLEAWRRWIGNMNWARGVYGRRYHLALCGSKSWADDLDAFMADFLKRKLKGEFRG